MFHIGEYVEVSGSVVTDIPHVNGFNAGWRNFWGTGFFMPVPDYKAAAGDWDAGHDESSETCPARWTEIHPPDAINYASGPPTRAEGLYGLAVVARAADISPSSATKSVTVQLSPPLPRPATLEHHYKAVATEHVGPESHLSTITNGNAALSGALIVAGRDAVTLSITVTGAPFAGPPGKFKAIYRVTWADDPATYHQVVSSNPAPGTVPYGVPTTLTISSNDNETGAPLQAAILLDGNQVGTTGMPTTATFEPTITRVWVPPEWDPELRHLSRGHWETVTSPPTVKVHAGAPYPDVSLAIGSATG
jgi:hypothetical protein